MSVYGGDSWGREANYRKRRVEDLMSDQLGGDDNSRHKKLSNGKYACLVCPNNPIFDSSLMLSMHNKGSRHITVEAKLKQRELMLQEEIKKRIILSEGSVDSIGSCTSAQYIHQKGKQMIASACSGKSKPHFDVKGKPLIERTVKATAEALRSQNRQQLVADRFHKDKRKSAPFFSPHSSSIPKKIAEPSQTIESGPICVDAQATTWVSEASIKMLEEHQMELLQRHERELKFTAAGWKRDGNGRWYRDENVEFDSDEEDPNICTSC